MGSPTVRILLVVYAISLAILWSVGLLGGSDPVRLVAYSLIVAVPFGAIYLILRLLAMRKEAAFERRIAAQGTTGTGASATGAHEMADQFRKGLRALRESHLSTTALTRLPWYLVIGAPGSGKSTALRESGLTFPSVGQGLRSFRGIGGTRNCDWWITDEAIFLDTAGRYTTKADDQQEWFGFLDLVRQHRRGMPLNGVMVTVSVPDLIKKDEAAVEAHAQTVRERIEEVADRLGVRLPVYLVFTKCDLIGGFKTLFADLGPSERDQVLGATLAWPPQEGDQRQFFEQEMGEILPGLAARRLRVLARGGMEDSETLKAVRFPSQLAVVERWMGHLIGSLFRPGRIHQCAALRGFYLTSGTQPGAHDKQDADAVSPAKAAEAAAPKPAAEVMPVGEERSIFLQPGAPHTPAAGAGGQERRTGMFLKNLFLRVMVPDAGLVQLSQKKARKRRLIDLGYRLAVPAIGVIVVVILISSYLGSRSVAVEAHDAIEDLRERRGGTAADHLHDLDRLRDLLVRLEHGNHLGLGDFRSTVAREYYRHLREQILTPMTGQLQTELRTILDQSEIDANRLYDLYKSYRVIAGELGDDAADAVETFAAVARAGNRWTAHLDQLDAAGREIADRQLGFLVDHPGDAERWAIANDDTLVRRINGILGERLWIPQSYDEIIADRGATVPTINRDALIAGPQRELLLNDYTFSSLFTQQGWERDVQPALATTAEQLERKLADVGQDMTADKIQQSLRHLYIGAAKAHWRDFVRNTRVAPAANLRDAVQKVGVLAGVQSPLQELVREVWRRRDIRLQAMDAVPVPEEEALAWYQTVNERLGELEQALQRFAGTTDFGKRSQAPDKLRELAEAFESLRLALPGILRAIPEPELQGAFQTAMENILGGIFAGVVSEVSEEQNTAWTRDVLRPFRKECAARYPFTAEAAAAVPLATFTRFFNPVDGVVSRHVTEARALSEISALGTSVLPLGDPFLSMAKRLDLTHRALFNETSPQLVFEFVITLEQREGVKDAAFTVHDRRFTLYENPDRRTRFVWTAQGVGGAKLAISIVEDRWLSTDFKGPWGLLRLLRAGEHDERDAGGHRFVWSFKSEALGTDKAFYAEAVLEGPAVDVLLSDPSLFTGLACPERITP